MTAFPPFRLDSLNQCLWRTTDAGHEERILMTPKAFAVLQYLVEHAGQLVTHEALLEAVWAGSVVELQAVKRNILEVRSALGDRPKNSLFIETLPRRGYRFIAPLSKHIASSPSVAVRAAHGTLVGRERALDELYEGLQHAVKGERQAVFITGEAGIGKTALVDEFRRLVASTALSTRIAQGQCVEGYAGKEPYYPMLDALGQLCAGPQGESIVQILAAQAPTWLVQFPALLRREHREMLQREILGATRERMLREISEALETITAECPLLLVFEDLQWVDHSTVDLISVLARRQAPAKLMLLATCRPFDLEPRDHPLKALAQDLLVHRLGREIAPAPLTEAEVAEYLAARSSSTSLPEGLSALLHQHSEGNPLFMVAALDHMMKRALISRENGSWQLQVPLAQIELAVPDDLRRMIEVQLDRLSPEEQRVLELASIVGASFSATVINSAAEVDPQTFEDLCEGLSRQHQIVRWVATQHFPDGTVSERYEFVHALYRQVLYNRQAPGRRARLHRRIGERLEALYSQRLDEIVAILAHHFESAADWSRTIQYLRLAADTAVRRYAPLGAAPMLQRALELATRLPEPERSASEIETLEKLATNYVTSADSRWAETCATLIEKAARQGLIDTEARGLLGLAWAEAGTSTQRCLDVLTRALKLSAHQHDPLLQARMRASALACRVWVSGWNAGDAEECRIALAHIREAGDPAILAPHLIDYSMILAYSSEYRESCRSLVEGRAILREAIGENPYLSLAYALAQYQLPFCLVHLGEWGAALGEIDAAVTMLDRNGDYYRAQVIRLILATLHLHAMDFAGARDLCEAAVPLARDPLPRGAPNAPRPHPLHLHWALILSGNAEAALGNHQRAVENLSAARQDMDRSMSVLDHYWRMFLEAGFTEVSLATGNLTRARADAQRFLEAALTTAERTCQALAWEANARVAKADLDLSRAKDCVAKALLTMEGFEVPLAAWRVHATAAQIDEESGELQSARSHGEVSRATILRLANSLPAEEPLRQIFLEAPAVARILNRGS
ncbi:MAG: transcriptional regulator, putative ATPase, winged helix family [Gammaproteobacteria bacterium]|nr:transcriptional regulator, putative ATPase, winged helix family [Gammaproteobacteria bacterium]